MARSAGVGSGLGWLGSLEDMGYQVEKSDAEWREELSPDEYAVLRQGGTEAPFSGAPVKAGAGGKFACMACGTPLFAADTKFESGSGWPSFDQALPGAIEYIADDELIEVTPQNVRLRKKILDTESRLKAAKRKKEQLETA